MVGVSCPQKERIRNQNKVARGVNEDALVWKGPCGGKGSGKAD